MGRAVSGVFPTKPTTHHLPLHGRMNQEDEEHIDA